MSEAYIRYGSNRFEPKKFNPVKNESFFCKPKGGMWASPVDAKYGWKDWCTAENFRECEDENRFRFRLKGNAKVYHIRSVADVKKMPERECGITTWYVPDFEKMIADGWDAIELHLSECGELYWALYGWDCDCILILNKDIIE